MKTIHVKDGDRIKIGETEIEIKLIPETKSQPSLVGKWVRALQETAHGTKINHWYPVEDENSHGLIILTGSQTNDLAWLKVGIAAYFDIVNPCDFDPNMPEAINPKYKVGEEVVVMDTMWGRPVYKWSFWFMGLRNKTENDIFEKGTKAKVFNVCYCKTNGCNLYALRDSQGNECVIGEVGIELVEVVNKEEWLAAASRLLDSWRKISGGYVSKENEHCYFVTFNIRRKELQVEYTPNYICSPFCFNNLNEAKKFISGNKTDLEVYHHIYTLN
jgi:hypothetical protein